MPTESVTLSEKTALDQVLEHFNSDAWKRMDEVEEVMEQLPQRELPTRHIFTPGLYTREIFMFAGTLLTSRIHLYEHPFVLLKGVVSVWTEESGWVKYSAPYHGVTKAGTRRILFVHEDAVWVTFHVTDKTDPDEIVRDVTYSQGKYESLGGAAAQPQLEIST